MNSITDLELVALIVACLAIGTTLGLIAGIWLMRRLTVRLQMPTIVHRHQRQRMDVHYHNQPGDDLPGDEWKKG